MVRRKLFVLVLSTAFAAPTAYAATATHVADKTVSRSATQIEYLDQGHGPAIVMSPSLGRSVRDFDAVANMVAADGFRVIRPEPRLSTKCRTSTAKKNCTKRNNRELFSVVDRRQEI